MIIKYVLKCILMLIFNVVIIIDWGYSSRKLR